MKSIWLFVTFIVVVTSADVLRPKRDVALIQNIIKWLLGINEGSHIQTVPHIDNEQDRVYTLPSYQKLLVKTIPRMEMNKNIRHVLTEGLYPGKVLRPVQPIQNINPIVYRNYPPSMRDYLNDRAYGHYRYDRPMYQRDINQFPAYKETVAPLCPTSVAKLACSHTTHTLVTEARPPLPQPPMYIQNRMREVILNRQIPTVQVQEDIVMPPPSLRRVDVSEYSVIDDRMAKNKQNPIKYPVKPVNEPAVHYQTFIKPILDETVAPLCPTSVGKLACSHTTRTLVTEARLPLPQPPMYIQNRMREVILNRQIPTVQVHEDIFMPPPSLRRVDVSEYSAIDDRMPKNKLTPSKNSVKPVNEEQNKPISKNKEVVETMTSWLQPKSDAESQLKTNENGPKKKVSFSSPVETKYKYKMIYHNQPDRNTIVEMDSMQAQTSNEETTLLPVHESTDQVKTPTPITNSENKVPADYIYIPPVNTEMPSPGAARVNTNMKSDSDNYSAVASENRPVVSMDDSTFTNAENKNKPTRVVIRRRKLKSRPESSRGDIPDHAL